MDIETKAAISSGVLNDVDLKLAHLHATLDLLWAASGGADSDGAERLKELSRETLPNALHGAMAQVDNIRAVLAGGRS